MGRKEKVEPYVQKQGRENRYNWRDQSGNVGEEKGLGAKRRAERKASSGKVKSTARKLWS